MNNIERSKILSPFQEKLILSVCPSGTYIENATYFQEEYLPCPIRVTACTPDQVKQVLVLRHVRHADGSIEKEAVLLRVLSKLKLPVPQVLVEPTPDPDLAGNQQVAVYSFLPGQNLQHLSESSEQGCQLAARLVIEATSRLALLTPDIEQQVSPDLIPRRTLTHQLAMIVNDGGPWLQDKRFLEAIKKLAFVFRQITDPLVFTNGDYQPANFLTDDEKVTGFVDFEHASYQDFLFGFVKYPIYDLHPLNKGGMISHLLKAKGISFAQFAPRLALGCLQTLQQEIPITEGADRYRHHVTGLLKAAVAAL